LRYTIDFTDELAINHELVGGKGANLGRLTAAGFTVPTGFTISTDAYSTFLRGGGLDIQIGGLLDGIDYGDADQVESVAAAIRALIVAADVPEDVLSAVSAAYASFGDERQPVAVRSSGTAEDLAEASFAGMHDTYLDIRGIEGVLDGVRRCWASLWTARATAYRYNNGFAHDEARLAVVIQQMVSAEAAGVMFTAHPVTGAVDQIIINASWGLGEAVVSGIVTPDEYTLSRETLGVLRLTIGDKKLCIVRAPEQGTLEQETPEADRRRASLTDAQAAELGHLGRRVTEYYEGFPQDIEWAYADGHCYLLQSRPITGVELSWDEDLEYFHIGKEEDHRDEFVYTRAWSDDFSIGAITPLYYTTRTKETSDNYHAGQVLYGHQEAAAIRSWKYYKGEEYFSCNMEAAWIPRLLPPYLRNAGSMNKLPPSWWEEVKNAPFSWVDYLKTQARIVFLDGRSGPYKYTKSFQERVDDRAAAVGLTNEELRRLSDREFQRTLTDQLDRWVEADADQWAAFFIYAPFAMGTLGTLLAKWYDGDIAQAFTDLLTGLPEPSITLVENAELWKLGETIKASPLLRRLLDEHEGASFFEELANHEEGRAFLVEYEPWRIKRGHRGAADRDFILARRIDDPAIDYNAFKALMAGNSADPLQNEEEHRRKRQAREDEVYAAIARQPLGFAKLEAFKLLQSWSLRFMAHRDDEREHLDLLAYTQRRYFLEMGRRLVEQGRFGDVDDVFFLGVQESFELMNEVASPALAQAKIAGRRRNFLRRQKMEVALPPYIDSFGAPALPGEQIGAVSGASTFGEDGRTILPGAGTSGGVVTGRARVLRDMSEIGSLEKGDILVCYATDPGWTPVFLVIGGLVMATGGVLAHGSCLSREYSLPAVVVPDATSRIEDGAIITLNGDLGQVEIAAAAADADAGAGRGEAMPTGSVVAASR
jgi:phosphohistidine swiveling domain-containing protein